ncbi:hypothetical protein EON79_12225 [bacterium]|nr:MAG: hypothetical protein EON79_12225 [bacterium]
MAAKAHLQPGYKIALGFGVVLAAYYLVLPAINTMRVRAIQAPPIAPDRIVMLGLAPSAGKIIVANNVAQVVENPQGNFGGTESAGEGATSGAVSKRLPIQDMLGALAGNGKSLGAFVMKMNDVYTNDESWPTEEVAWSADRLRKALDGDPKERAALEHDLNTTLDGQPLRQLSTRALYNGIIVETPVTVVTEVDGQKRNVTGTFQTPYKPSLLARLDKSLSTRAVTESELANEYGAVARRVLDGEEKPEDVRKTLEGLLDPAVTAARIAPVERLLQKTSVVVNSRMIAGAQYAARQTNDGTVYDLTIRLTDDGRNRLWKYSHDRVGTQILLVADGTAIAAPLISHELSQGELVISQMRDETLVKDAVETINAGRASSR